MITSPLEDELTNIGGFEVVLSSPTTPKQSTFRAEHEDEPTTPVATSFSPRWPSSPTSSPEPTTPESSPPTSLLSTPATSFSSSTTDSPEYERKAPTTFTTLSPSLAPTTSLDPFASILDYELKAPAPPSPSATPTTPLGPFASILGHDPADTTTPVITPASCLQCSLLNLPCSQTHPTCTRCARNHERDFGGWYGVRDIIEPCLAQRRRTMQEILEGKEMGQTEMLCRLESDGDGTWEQKLEMASELLRKKMEVRRERTGFACAGGEGGAEKGGVEGVVVQCQW